MLQCEIWQKCVTTIGNGRKLINLNHVCVHTVQKYWEICSGPITVITGDLGKSNRLISALSCRECRMCVYLTINDRATPITARPTIQPATTHPTKDPPYKLTITPQPEWSIVNTWVMAKPVKGIERVRVRSWGFLLVLIHRLLGSQRAIQFRAGRWLGRNGIFFPPTEVVLFFYKSIVNNCWEVRQSLREIFAKDRQFCKICFVLGIRSVCGAVHLQFVNPKWTGF